MFVIARAYGDEPLRRIATGHARGLTYLVNPEAVENSEVEAMSGVGFPDSAVFVYEDKLFNRLRLAWENQDQAALAELWLEAEAAMATT